MKFISIGSTTTCEKFEGITHFGNQGEFALEAAEILEFEQDEDDMTSCTDIMEDEDGKLYACRFDDISCVEYVEVSHTTKIQLNESDFREVLEAKMKTAHGFEWTGCRIPIYCNLDDIFEEGETLEPELSSGSWLSQGSYQPDALEVTKIEKWDCADWKEGGWDSEDDYDEDVQIDSEIDTWLDEWDWKEDIENSIKEWLETQDLELDYEIEWI